MLGAVASAVEASTALDLFTGTTRVARELKGRGIHVTACDIATYSEVLGRCYVETDADAVDHAALADELARLDALPGVDGYVTETFCENARYFQPHNGRRIDAIRDAIEADHADSPLRPLLLTSLLLAADRVDSTTGLQMAYLKQWAPRSYADLRLRIPALLPGPGRAVRGDSTTLVDVVEPVDLAYLDPPYNQHRYYTNYHVWETIVRWDAPEHYGVACKRVDARDPATKSIFNRRREMPGALADLIARVRAEVVVVSHNDESWVGAEDIARWLHDSGHDTVEMLAFDRKRYVGARIGIHGPTGAKVGTVSHLHNQELVFIAGPHRLVSAAVEAAESL